MGEVGFDGGAEIGEEGAALLGTGHRGGPDAFAPAAANAQH